MEVTTMKKRNALIIIIAMLFVTCFMAGCSASTQTDRESKDIIKEEEKEEFGTFVVLFKKNIQDSDITQYILYDPDTMVMWTFMDGYRCGGPSVIYNADGTPKLYQPK